MAQQQHLLVIDLETQPDLSILPVDYAPEVFPKPIQHQIVTLGFLLARIEREGEREHYQVRKLGSACIANRSEREILAGFWQMVDTKKPRLITWNGRSFDIAVLKQRSLIHGLTAINWHRTEPRFGYDYRYECNWHCDLMDVLSDFGASPRLGLDETARALGLPGKWNGQGDTVSAQAAAGDYPAINRYCEGDVLNTYVIYLRWAYLTSRLSAHGHNSSIKNLQTYLDAERIKQIHWGEFLDRWQIATGPHFGYIPEISSDPSPQPPDAHLRSEDVLS